MPLTIHSPHSGRPVKIRDEDVGRAVRDQDNRVFYVVPRASGEGYYGAVTRKGSAKDEERYDRLAANPAEVATASPTAAPVHDATGGRRQRRPLRRAALTLVVLGGLAIGGALGLDQLDLLPEAIDRWLPELGAATPPAP